MNNRNLAHRASEGNWRVRAHSHKQNIAELLKQRGEQALGVRASELYDHRELYGRSPRNRISELNRDDAWDIGSKPYGQGGDWFYWVRSDASGRVYPTQRFEPVDSTRPQLPSQSESAFMRHRREDMERDAPLFAAVGT